VQAVVRSSGHRYFYFRAMHLNLSSIKAFLPSGLAGAAGFVLWAVGAVVLRGMAPWFFWLTTAALPAAALVRSEAGWLKSRRGRLVLAVCGGLFVVHCGWAVVRAQHYDAAKAGTYWLDDHNYFEESAAIAEVWRAGNYPEIWRKGSPPYLGTLHTGYHRALTTAFLTLGTGTLSGLFLNALGLCLLPLLAGLCARFLFEDLDAEPGRRGGAAEKWWRDTPVTAAVLVAVHPAQFYWSAYLMKDAWTAFAFLGTMAVMLGAIRRRNVALWMGATLLVPYLFTVRIYAAVSIVFGAMLLPGLRLQRRHFFGAMFTGAALLILLLAYTERGNDVYRQMRDSLAALAPPGVSGPVGMLRQLGAGIPRLFLAPYAWLILPEPSPMYGMYPGMWFLYLVGYPLAFSGVYAAVRQNVRLTVVPMAAIGVAGLIFLAAQYGGNASRQRYYLEPVILVFAAYGLKYPSRWWIVGVLVAELAWGIGQVIAMG
jgi:hypothetical protein